ncbi:hypothetical protein RRF57_006807 [Xylaria bambusicola]|uniref:Uncharacterized protein n=1 Tax=Xylaria bambusicola TaxID=326684 RepID=A0AAN7ULT0_9PEZI
MSLSRSTTATLGFEDPSATSIIENGENNAPSNIQRGSRNRHELISNCLMGAADSGVNSRRLIMGIDFGTTCSSVSFIALKAGERAEYAPRYRIQSIMNYPEDMNDNAGDPMRLEVPSEVIYPLDKHFRKKARLAAASQDNIRQYNQFDGLDQDGNSSGDPMQVDSDEDNMVNVENVREFQWGYSVHTAWRFRDTHTDPETKALTRFKLLLHRDEETEVARKHLAPIIERLKAKKVIKSPLDVIADYLTCLLRHTKSELQAQNLYDGYNVEIVLCVPAIWKQQACRDMQTALAIALKAAEFETVDVQNNSINNLFIVSEPEAAAAHVLRNERNIKVSRKCRAVDMVLTAS